MSLSISKAMSEYKFNTMNGLVINTRFSTPPIFDCQNVYTDLRGHIRPRKNPTRGMYQFDGQIFYRKKVANA